MGYSQKVNNYIEKLNSALCSIADLILLCCWPDPTYQNVRIRVLKEQFSVWHMFLVRIRLIGIKFKKIPNIS